MTTAGVVQSNTGLELSPGAMVGRYRLICPLASGGMAQVWAAEPGRKALVRKTVAVKVIRPDIAGDSRYADMFVDEANVAMAIDHPNVCRTHEWGYEGNLLFMSMEWIPGDSLAGMLRRDGRIEPLEKGVAVRVVADALAGIHAAHECQDGEGQPLGVIHRDVSPPNILVSLTGQVKVNDFGIAKAKHQLHERTRTGEVKGKFGYLAPEQIKSDRIDRRVDVYAMGCVLYVATLGLRPFGHGPDAMTKILRGQVKRPSEVEPGFPPGLEAIIEKAISKSPDCRYETAFDMKRSLERWLVDERRVVTQGHVARCLQERIAPRMLDTIRQLQSRRGSNKLIDSGPVEELRPIEPDTASTGVLDSVRKIRAAGARNEDGPLDGVDGPTHPTAFDSDPLRASREASTMTRANDGDTHPDDEATKIDMSGPREVLPSESETLLSAEARGVSSSQDAPASALPTEEAMAARNATTVPPPRSTRLAEQRELSKGPGYPKLLLWVGLFVALVALLVAFLLRSQ